MQSTILAPSPRYPIPYQPLDLRGPVVFRGRPVEDSPVTKRPPPTASRALTNVGEHSETFPLATESYWSLRWTSTTSAASAPSRQLPFRAYHEGNTMNTDPPALCCQRPVPLPTQYGIEVTLHLLLLAPKEAGFHWDLTRPYEGVDNALEGRWNVLRSPATFPALPSMTVVHPWLPWPITVQASGLDSKGVTVVDVLVSISRELLLPVQEETGRTRFEFLRGHRMFLGLKMSGLGGDVWEFVVG
ncbi:hypothetical protein PM082_007233 [Marasmius tenuissimus]|nr:hypothetical protein PM082_007233 [Marasmius tenuissimus]